MPRRLWVVIGLAAASLQAQQRAQVAGVVHDSSDAVLLNAAITITNTDSGVRRSAHSDEDGNYVVASLPAGLYKMMVRKDGFQTISRLNVNLDPGQNARLDFTMQVGSMRQVITINDGPPLVNAEDGSVGVQVERDLIDKLPLNGRGVLSLLDLAPGVVTTPATAGEAGQFSTNGQRPNMNYFTVDGVSANSSVSGGALPAQFAGGGLPAMTAFGSTQNLATNEDLQEVRIQTSSFAPEFGRLPGAHVGLATRGGSNDFHASLFYMLRNEALTANDWFANREGLGRPALGLNDWGGSAGGPLRRDRTFFFASYEGLRLTQPFTWLSVVPSEAARAQASPAARALLNAFPHPNAGDLGSGLAEFTALSSGSARLDTGSFRIDHSLTPRHSLFVRYNEAPSSTAYGSTQIDRNQFESRNVTLGVNSIFPGDLNNDLRVNYSRAQVQSRSLWTGLGGSTLPDFSKYFAGASVLPGSEVLYGFGIAGIGDILSGASGPSRQGQWNVVETLGINRGEHALRLGADYQRLTPARDGVSETIAGQYRSLADLLAGNPLDEIQARSDRATSRITTLSLFFQDTWRVHPRLALTYGTRWEFTPAPGIGIDPAILPPAQPATRIWNSRYTQFAPRAGAAFRISPHSVLRAGWGIFYDLSFSVATDPINGVPFNRWQFTSAAPFTPVPTVSSVREYVYAKDLRIPYSMEWNVAYENALTPADIVSLSYVGSSGHDLLRREGQLAASPPSAQEVVATNHGASRYHGLEVQYRRRLARGLQGLVSYTWSHSMDNGSFDSGLYLVGPGFSAARDWASVSFDVRHSFNAALSYDLPGAHSMLLRNWALDGILRVRSGFPMDVLENQNVLGLGFDNVTRPDVVPGVSVWLGDPGSPGGRRLNSQAFRAPVGPQGDLGRNALTGFGLSELDLAVRREFRVGNESVFQIRVEAFNALNHPAFGDPVRFLNSPLFGQSASMLNAMLGSGSPHSGLTPAFQIGGPRSLQITLKLRF